MGEIRGDRALLHCLTSLLESAREELVIGFGHRGSMGGDLFLVDECRLAADHEVRRDLHGLHWSGELTSVLYAEAKRSGRGILLLHAHQGSARVPRLSETDLTTADEILSHFGRLLPTALHGYAVMNSTHIAGWMQLGKARQAIDRLRIAANPLRQWPGCLLEGIAARDRDKRQVGALGSRGVEQLYRSTVGIVGLGGAGSQVAEMLAHAGAGELLLVDPDVVKDVNLSRTHGTSVASIGLPKVESARRMIEEICPETKVQTWVDGFPSPAVLRVLSDVDVVVAAVDNVHTRNELNRFALRYAVPLVDVGTTISEAPMRVDGHLSLVLPGGHCLRCAGHVSDALLEEDEEVARQGNYGMSEGRPQVVSFNGLLASAAVTEVLKLVTGFAGDSEGSHEWHYDGVSGEMRTIGLMAGSCSECDWFGLKGDDA